jgi:hypothetical protein
MEKRRYRMCICCKRIWNVSIYDRFPDGIYICPECAEKEDRQHGKDP